MKIKPILLLALLALPAVPAWATLPFAAPSDIIISFGDGTNQSLEVDGGAVTQLVAGNTLTFDLTTQLNTLYGASWYTDSTLIWGVSAGVQTAVGGVPAGAMFLAVDELWGGGQTLPAPLQGIGTLMGTIRTAVSAGIISSGLLTGSINAVALGDGISYSENPGATGGFWADLHGSAPGSYSGIQGLFNGNYAVSGESVTASDNEMKMYYWQQVAKTVAPNGTWTLGTDPGDVDTFGVLTFTPEAAAVPEPSTYALMAIAGGFFLLVLRVRALRAA